MTANQINYGKLLEDSRNHRVLEQHSQIQAEAARSQAVTASKRQVEDARHNQESERVNWWSAQEQGRHNLATEAFQSGQLSVLQRQAAVAERQATVQEGTLAELIANNAFTRAETQRANIARENVQMQNYAEQARSNRANEQIRREQNLISQNANEEIRRANLARESIQRAQHYEQVRTNKANESIASSRVQEEHRSNLAQEMLSNTRNRETTRHNIALENQEAGRMRETSAHNQASEEADLIRARASQVQAVSRAVEAVPGIAKDLMILIGGLTS